MNISAFSWKILLLLVMVLPHAGMSHAAGEGPALEALETLRRGFAGTSDFTAAITQEKRLSLMKQKMISKGVVRFKKPDMFYMELYPPHASRLLLKDNILTMRLPKEGVTDRINLPPEEGLAKWFDYLAKPVTSLPSGLDVRGERQGDIWTLRILPGSKGGVRELRLVFDSGGRIKSVAIEEKNSDHTLIRFQNLKRNTGLKEQDFQVE